jgi:hypothetical protein
MSDSAVDRAQERHGTRIGLAQPVPADVDAGASVTVQVSVACTHRCDLTGRRVAVFAGDRVLAECGLALQTDGRHLTEPMRLEAPDRLGEHLWEVRFAQVDEGTIVHEAATCVLLFRTRPHTTSLAVWDVPVSPVSANGSFSVKVGLKCSAGCRMAGHPVTVEGETGFAAGTGHMTEEPWPGTTALFWTDVQVRAPAAEGVMMWRARFTDTGCGLPHDESAADFSIRVAEAPQHRVAIALVTRGKATPIPNAEVRLGPYVGFTDGTGRVDLTVPAGTYELRIRSDGHDLEPFLVDVQHALEIGLEAHRTLTKAEWEDQLAEFKHIPWG